MQMKVLVTGHRGYIGAHLVGLLKEAGHHVTGCDLDLFEGCDWEQLTPPDREIVRDVRALTLRDLEGQDCVMHLAAISNDPMGDLDPEITRDINARGSIALAQKAKAAGVPRFLFSSSCSIYGKAEDRPLAEQDELNPVSVYAESKIVAEEGIAPLANKDFSPAFLRNSTAYGDSPMLRIDLVVNNLLGCAVAKGDIRIMSDGTPWRPLIHCRDIARAFVAFLEAPREAIHNQSVNIGGDVENYQVRDIADIIRRLVPGGIDRLYRRGRQGPARLPRRFYEARPVAARLPARIHLGRRHGGAARAILRPLLLGSRFRWRQVRPAAHLAPPSRPADIARDRDRERVRAA